MKSLIVSSLIICGFTALTNSFAQDARLDSITHGDATYQTQWPEYHVIGSDVQITVNFISSEPLTDALYLTAFKLGTAIPLPVVTRTQPAKSVGGNQYQASYSFELSAPEEITKYRLSFWSTSKGGQDKFDVGEARLITYPMDQLEPLRLLASANPFVIDTASKSKELTSLKNLLNTWQIDYTEMNSSLISDLPQNSVFFTTNKAVEAASKVAGIKAVIFSKDVSIPVIQKTTESAVAVVPSDDFSSLDQKVAQQLGLIELTKLLTE